MPLLIVRTDDALSRMSMHDAYGLQRLEGTLLGGDRGAMRSHVCQGECLRKVLHAWGGKGRDDQEATQGGGNTIVRGALPTVLQAT